ncbi:MAG: ComEC/Rec2 family competence protein, partial [Patescibacteria group bacterium]
SAGIVGIIAFAIMTGASETTVRASIMAILVVVATALRRPADALRLLIVAATAMLFLNPYLLLYDLSFQLSCLATFGLIFLSAPIAKYLTWIPEKFSLREVAAATIATEIVVAPLLIISVGQLSVVAIFTNLLVLCAVPWTMLFGFIAVCISFLSIALAFPIATLTYGLLSYILTIAIWLGSLPFAVINIPPEMSGIALLVLAILYATLGWFLFRFRQKIFLMRSTKK